MTGFRLFFALWPNDEVVNFFNHAMNDKAFAGCGRKIAKENLHLTLAFLGTVDGQQKDQIVSIANQWQVPPFELVFDHFGYWKKPKVVWAGVSHVPQELTQFVDGLRGDLASLHYEVETRPYIPHLTLFRKVAKRPKLPEMRACRWQVSSFCLVSSTLTQRGAQYDVIKSWGFG